MSRSTTRQVLKRSFPHLIPVVHFVRRLPWRYGSMEQRFRRMYGMYVRDRLESLSGPGSTLQATRVLRTELPALVRELQATSLLDIPCGDFNWMKETELDLESYFGADILGELIDANIRHHDRQDRTFQKLDLTRDPLPRADLVLCRDCLVHLSFSDLSMALVNIKRSGSTHLLTTTFTGPEENLDIYSGEWRRLNLERAPFHFPPPVRVINEQCPVEEYSDKSLGLWRIADLPVESAGPVPPAAPPVSRT